MPKHGQCMAAEGLWPMGPGQKTGGALSSPARYYCWVGIGPPIFLARAHEPKALCGHVLGMFGHIYYIL